MSLLNVVPDSVTAAAGNLHDIGAAVENANAVAAAQTTAIAAPAADEVSAAITALFGASAKEFQTLSAEAMAFHHAFADLLNGGAARYLDTEFANVQQMLVNAVNSPGRALLGHWLMGTGQGALGSAAANPAESVLNWLTRNLGDTFATVTENPGEYLNGQFWEAILTKALGTDTAELGLQIGIELGGGNPYLTAITGPLGLLTGYFAPEWLAHAIDKVTGLGDTIESYLTTVGDRVTDFEDSLWYGVADKITGLENTIQSHFTDGAPQLFNSPTQLSNWGLGPSIAITSDVVGPWGADGIQQDVTGVFTLGAGPFNVQVGSFQGMSAADMYGGMASGSATVFGIRESGSVYSSNGGAPQFSFSVDAPGVTGLLQDWATYLP